MKTIALKRLELKNFKGIKELSINFGSTTNIYGENATGKTTVFDSFTWLLFDKDSQDRKDFEIKTIDKDGEVMHGLEHEVNGILNVSGRDLKLSKIYKEKWTKKRGEAEKQLTGHETLYYIDDVPVKQSEYKEKVNSIIDENIFKLITNPLCFSNMNWQTRRKALLDIIGDISAEKVINYKADLKQLEKLLEDKDVETLKKSIAARKKKLNDDIKSIPCRVDELNNSIQEYDFGTLEAQRQDIKTSISTVDAELVDGSKVNEVILNKKNRLYELKEKQRDIEYKAKLEADKPLNALQSELREVEKEQYSIKSIIDKLTFSIQNDESQIENKNQKVQQLRTEWHEVNNATLNFPDDEFICPTCKRRFDEADVETKKEEMQENFNMNKASKLESINSTGKTYKGEVEKLKEEIENYKSDLNMNEEKIKEIISHKQEIIDKIDGFKPVVNLEGNTKYMAVKKEIEELENILSKPVNKDNAIEERKMKKRTLSSQLEDINRKLGLKEQNEKTKARINELMADEKKLAQQIAELEGQEFLCEEFIKTKVELLENSINEKFKYVKFKLFNTLVNGAIEECCEVLIDGVPYSSANSAGQINAGLDIINAMSNYYQVEAPIFIDNRESINDIIDTNAQVINLIVSRDKKLRIDNNLESEVA